MGKADRSTRGATIIDVAAHAGVSPMTVSRVLNDRSGVRPETREAVQRSVQALSYSPNIAARSLVTSAELRIGVIYSNPSAAFMSEFLTGVFEEASARGVRLVLLKGLGGQAPSEEALQQFMASGISAALLAPPLGESPLILRVLSKARLPIAAVAAYDVKDAICVRIDDRQAAYEMTRHLIELGHRRIGFVIGNPDQAASRARLAGFHDAVREVRGVETILAQGDYSYASGLIAGERLLDDPRPPTAIFASNDDMAAAVVSVAHRRHLDVPHELTVAGFDDTTSAVTLWPPLTTVRQPVHAMAVEALSLLVTEIGGSKGKGPLILDHDIVKRQSTAPPRRERIDVPERKPRKKPVAAG